MHKIFSISLLLILITCSKNDLNKQQFKPIFYNSNYVTWWDVVYGNEETQNMDIYLRGKEYVSKDSHNVRLKGALM